MPTALFILAAIIGCFCFFIGLKRYNNVLKIIGILILLVCAIIGVGSGFSFLFKV